MVSFHTILNYILRKIDRLFFRKPVVLTYHSVSDGKTPISVATGSFRQQMNFLKDNKINILTLKEFLESKTGVLITFDDAFKDVYTNALPILKEYNFPAAIFVNTSLVGKTASFATRPEDRARAICSLDDLLVLEEGRVTIANHGHSHRQLSSLNDDDVAREYEKAHSWIKTNFRKNARPDVFVFPKGAKNEKVKNLLRRKGATVLDDRIDVYPDTSMTGFVLRLSRLYHLLRREVFLIN